MKNQTNISPFESTFGKVNSIYKTARTISFLLIFTFIASASVFSSCEDSGTNSEEEQETEPTVVEVTAFHNMETGEHEFVTETDEIPSGWTTIRFNNSTGFVHFVFLSQLPGDKTVDDQVNEIFPIFQAATYLIKQGQFDEANAQYANLPAWSAEVVYRGGVGFVSGGNTVETTMFLPSGNYVMECYILDSNNDHHYTNGMYKGLTVTDEESDAVEPDDADIEMELTGNGFGVQGTLTPGQHKVAVNFTEAAPGLFGYDVHLARLDQSTDITTVTSWMDSATPTGLISDEGMHAPAQFLGGTHDMPVGNTAYFTVDLEPGRYAWIMEQPSNASIYEEFTVSN